MSLQASFTVYLKTGEIIKSQILNFQLAPELFSVTKTIHFELALILNENITEIFFRFKFGEKNL